MALGRPTKSLRCHFIAFIIIDGLTSFGKSGHLTMCSLWEGLILLLSLLIAIDESL
jgi:hypothetical protein